MNLMFCYDYQSALVKKLEEFEEMLKDVNQKKLDNEKQTSSIGIQCDTKNLQNRTSLKRVSIADTKIVYDLEESQSQSQSHQSLKEPNENEEKQTKSRQKSKGRAKAREVKIEHEEPSDYEEEIKHQNPKKSRKKASKTPNKRSKK